VIRAAHVSNVTGTFGQQIGDVVCGHCAGRTGSCHVCRGARRVLELVAERAIGAIWGQLGCCDACRRVGPQPVPAPRDGHYDVSGFVGGGVSGDY
jgi:hypothetical protein